MQGIPSRDLHLVVQHQLRLNPHVKVLVEEYARLTELDRTLFRVAAGISQHSTGNFAERCRTSGRPPSATEPGKIQPLVRDLMKTLLEDYPTILTCTDIRNMMDKDYCKLNLGLRISNFPLLRNMEAGRIIKGHSRYWDQVYAGKFYVCKEWWKDNHLANAESLLRFVTELAARRLDHPGIPAVERHKKAVGDYISLIG